MMPLLGLGQDCVNQRAEKETSEAATLEYWQICKEIGESQCLGCHGSSTWMGTQIAGPTMV